MEQIIESLQFNESKDKEELERKIELLSQENNVLISYMENLKQYKEVYDNMADQKNEEIDRAQEEYNLCYANLQEAIGREHESNSELNLLQQRNN